MGDLIGGLCDAGFHILRYVERASEDESATPGSDAHLAAYVRPYLTIYSQRFL